MPSIGPNHSALHRSFYDKDLVKSNCTDQLTSTEPSHDITFHYQQCSPGRCPPSSVAPRPLVCVPHVQLGPRHLARRLLASFAAERSRAPQRTNPPTILAGVHEAGDLGYWVNVPTGHHAVPHERIQRSKHGGPTSLLCRCIVQHCSFLLGAVHVCHFATHSGSHHSGRP